MSSCTVCNTGGSPSFKEMVIILWFVLQISCLPLGVSSQQRQALQPVYICKNGTAYAKGSEFERNLNTVLDQLVRGTSPTGFNTSSYGQGPNKVYGLLQCRGNLSQSDCFACSQKANTSLRQQCGNVRGGRVWLDLCYLRYDNYSFFSRLDTQTCYLVNTLKIPNRDVFRNATLKLLEDLAAKAVAPANRGFSAGSSPYASSNDVFGMVQCWRDLTFNSCKTCLASAINVVSKLSERQGAEALLGSCTARYDIHSFLTSEGGPTSPSPKGGLAPLSPKTPPSAGRLKPHGHITSKRSSKKQPIIWGVVGGVVLALIICLLTFRISKMKFRKPVILSHNQGHEDTDFIPRQEQIVMFDLKTLIAATDNFHDHNKLGQGGFGPVYKGITSDGREIAVKKLSVRSGQGQREFMNEVKVVAQVQHRNLVKLLGCCAEGSEKLLVYEYLPNKSLDVILFDVQRQRRLDWQQRYAIILGIARGLHYLHHDSQPKIVHRDIKASNILLDDKLNPKISDFGLARIFTEDESQVDTRVAGTYGYMAPEYAMQGQLSVKSDVYSFGVLLLEIVSGRKNTDFNAPPEKHNLLGWAWRLHKRRNTREIIDPTLNIQPEILHEQALRCIHVGLLCAQAQAAIRPHFSEIIMMISNTTVTLQDPKKPAFLSITEIQKSPQEEALPQTSATTSSRSSGATSQRSNLAPLSRNEASISDIEPR